MPEHADIFIAHAHLFTMQGAGVGYIADGAVAVRGSQIVAVGTTAELSARYEAAETIDATECAVLPGLIDAHMHTTLSIVRGVAQDVRHWMQKALAPYSKHITHQAQIAGTRLNALEALKAGTTTQCDYGGVYPGWAEFYEQSGIRARLAPVFNALPPGGMAGWRVGDLYPFDLEHGRRSMARAVEFCRQWDGAAGGRITCMLGAHAPDMMPLEMLLEAREIGRREGWMLHVHVAQGDREIEQMCKRYGKRTIPLLDEAGFLDEGLLAVHLTEATDEEAARVARSGARLALCSGSIGIIDGIVPPARAFREAGGLVALGSDQACGNNCNNIFNEMKLTALFNKIQARDPTVFPAWEVLRMATIEGARAVGLGDEVGSLEVGKQADLILVDLTALNLTPVLEAPVRNIVPNLVYAGSGHEVVTVMVAGKVLVQDGKVLVADEAAVRAEAQAQAEEVARRVAADPVHREMALLEQMAQGQL